VHIQSKADNDDVNGMMTRVMIAMMIVLVMVNIALEGLNQVDSVRQHWCTTFQQLIDFNRPNASQQKLNSSRCLHLPAIALKDCTIMQSSSRL
jgi:hypothetical protein